MYLHYRHCWGLEYLIERDACEPVDQLLGYLARVCHELTSGRGRGCSRAWFRWFSGSQRGSSARHTRATVVTFDRLRVVVHVAARAQRDPEQCFDLFRYSARVGTMLPTQVYQQSSAIGQKVWFSWVLVTEWADVEHISIVI